MLEDRYTNTVADAAAYERRRAGGYSQSDEADYDDAYDHAVCEECGNLYEIGYGPDHGLCPDCLREEGTEVTTLRRHTRQRARKDYPQEGIQKGQHYWRRVTAGYIVGGPRWMRVSRSQYR